MGTVLKMNDENAPGHGITYPQNFLWFWKEYPNKVGKLDALRAWQKTEKLRPQIEALIAAIRRQKCSDKWTSGYIPNPGKWLREGRWDDE